MSKKQIFPIGLLILCFSLMSCGQTGALYLPKKPTQTVDESQDEIADELP